MATSIKLACVVQPGYHRVFLQRYGIDVGLRLILELVPEPAQVGECRG